MPLVNAHTHLELSHAEIALPTTTMDFADWLARVAPHAVVDPEQPRQACEFGIAELLAAGTTHVGDISWTGASIEPLKHSGLAGIVWLELRGMVRSVLAKRLAHLQRRMDVLRASCANSRISVGITLHSPYTIHPSFWEPMLRWMESESLPCCIHAAESAAEWKLFTEGAGPLGLHEARMVASPLPRSLRQLAVPFLRHGKPLLSRLGLPYVFTTSETPIAYLERVGLLDLRPLLVHMVHVTDDDLDRVRRHRAMVVHCPRSNQLLSGGRMPLEKFLTRSIPVLMGTDSRASSPSLDVGEELQAAQLIHADRVDSDRLKALISDEATFAGHYHGDR
jgi:cytosine/adenosine deaminase-related metal-dependent hydrolase